MKPTVLILDDEVLARDWPYTAARLEDRLRQAATIRWAQPTETETLDWAAALAAMGRADLDEATINDTLGVLLKYQDDVQRVRGETVHHLLQRAHGRR